MLYKKLLLASALLICSISIAQEKVRKEIATTRVDNAPKIDGNLDDKAWENTEICKNFTEWTPNNGVKVNPDYATEVKVIYDDDALYISAKMLDPEPTKIPRQFASRDNFSQADFFLVAINPNDDGQNPFLFIVQTTGNQIDGKVSNGDEDFNWSAVWESNTKITDYGWNVEIKIPYRALRFSNRSIQSWGFNFHRNMKRLNVQQTWNPIDNSKAMWSQYDGLITNFRDIKPPTRLSFYPYASTSVSLEKAKKTTIDRSIGMDIKYGLSENFTLDATLIPDFSQAAFDNVQLNLGPFEQQFSEQRAFFTEGTELFNKSGLFYSRRIGGEPINRDNIAINNNEIISKNPVKTQLINAFKISGRTKKGLGIGFMNAITDKSEAEITNSVSKKTRKVTTQSLTNYNIFVIDKQFNKNSYINFTNTNVLRNGTTRDANASSLKYHITTKNNEFFIRGSLKATSTFEEQTNTGYSFFTSLGKNSGNWRGYAGYLFSDENFNPNDLGYSQKNNISSGYGKISYETLKPKGVFNFYDFSLMYESFFLNHDKTYTGSKVSGSTKFTTKNRLSFGLNTEYSTKVKDFFEAQQPTTDGLFFTRNPKLNIKKWLSSDYRKKIAIDYSISFLKSFNIPKLEYGFYLSPRYRFNNQFSLIYKFNYNKNKNDRGFVTVSNNDFIFGTRNRQDYENTMSGKYNFSIKSAITLSLRHNWSKVDYNKFHKLNTEGYFDSTNYNENKNVNFNRWNIDLNYQWQFAPGSQLTAFYRNTIFDENKITNVNFSDNITNLFKKPTHHLLSLKVVYFIDYNQLKSII